MAGSASYAIILISGLTLGFGSMRSCSTLWKIAKLSSIFVACQVHGAFAQPAKECKDRKEPVTASGPARPTDIWAKAVATNMWRRQVQAKYGEMFEDVNYADKPNYICTPTSFGRRCTQPRFHVGYQVLCRPNP